MGKERMLIEGGHALEGQVRVSGGKNTAVAVIPATLLCDEPCTIENLPDIEDVHALADILAELGAVVEAARSVPALLISTSKASSPSARKRRRSAAC